MARISAALLSGRSTALACPEVKRTEEATSRGASAELSMALRIGQPKRVFHLKTSRSV